jgi:hypothetical protein
MGEGLYEGHTEDILKDTFLKQKRGNKKIENK